MQIQGKNILGFEVSASGQKTFRGFNPRSGQAMEPEFWEGTPAEVDRALDLASAAAVELRRCTPEQISDFLLAIGEEINGLGDELIHRASEETALDTERLKGERDRTVNQIKMFASVIAEGSWVNACIDTAAQDRKPVPKPDVRRMLEPIGPVAVFGASNFPLAFSIAGGDTASALAARNPVIAKAHPAHPGTSELVADAIVRAVKSKGLPEGTFSMLHGLGTEVSISLVRHPKLRALAFTGSQRAGRALFDAAAARPNPIPVFAEMGSVNPVFLLPEALATNPRGIADGTARSVMLGVGQFCTCPGLIFAQDGAGFDDFVQRLTEIFKQAAPGSMLNPAIRKGYVEKLESASKVQGVQRYEATKNGDVDRTEGQPALLVTDAPTWLKNHVLHEEIFGPATLVIRCTGAEEVVQCSRELEGTLTATIHAEPGELASHSDLVDTLSRKAGRLVFNGFPTGVEVGHAMHHGGPYPATTDEKFTSVGSSAIYRFARPICFQNFPDAALPPELQNANPRNIWRLIDGRLTKDAL